ncbi:DgyrCDS6209 [Dimorphilus gyrociliatus]|uniref:DgyrCDS6209 n=1 Tax=Dimorphilus gyrociliatus TaxID=2664684 RepID=A0A7I8VN59_9ANNE|nr:DgyrCDS6209 [Dimorphilus gyrociliatus]
MSAVQALQNVLEEWKNSRENRDGYLKCLKSIGNILQEHYLSYLKMDPDPNDERHPLKIKKESLYASMLEYLTKEDDFMNSIYTNYVLDNENDEEVLIAASCVSIMLMPALDHELMIKDEKCERLVKKLFKTSLEDRPVISYFTTAFLSIYITDSNLFATFRDETISLIKLAVNRLKSLQGNIENCEPPNKRVKIERPFAMFGKSSSSKPISSSPKVKPYIIDAEHSNSSWLEQKALMVPEFSLHAPLSDSMKQRLLLKFMAPVSEYQDVVGILLEKDIIQIVFNYINMADKDIGLVLDGLKVLSCLLCHKKIASSVVDYLVQLLDVPIPSTAATMVPCCIYYTCSFQDILRTLCTVPNRTLVRQILDYTLSAMDKLHLSAKVYSAMFLQSAFSFRYFLDQFDQFGGLRTLLNLLSTLKEHAFNPEKQDEMDVLQQAIEQVLQALKSYVQTHLAIRVNQLERQKSRNDRSESIPDLPYNKPIDLSSEAVEEQIEFLQNELPLKARWTPIYELISNGHIDNLCRLLTAVADWSDYARRDEVLTCLIEILSVCSTVLRAQLTMLNNTSEDDSYKNAFAVLFGLIDNREVEHEHDNFEVRKAALSLIKNCVSSPVKAGSYHVMRYGITPKKKLKSTPTPKKPKFEILQKMWQAFRDNAGIFCLSQYLEAINHTDETNLALQTLVVKCFIGLSRCSSIKQILIKLPLFKDNLKQITENAANLDYKGQYKKFDESVKKLLKCLDDGKKKRSKTHVTFDDNELLPLIHKFLKEKGFQKTVTALQTEEKEKKHKVLDKMDEFVKYQLESNTPKLEEKERKSKKSEKLSKQVCLDERKLLKVSELEDIPNKRETKPSKMTKKLSDLGDLMNSQEENSRERTDSDENSQKSIVKSLKNDADDDKFNQENMPKPVRKLKIVEKFLSPSTKLYESSPIRRTSSQTPVSMRLQDVVMDYLEKQHAECKKPMHTCPPFNFSRPHSCPIANKHLMDSDLNITLRLNDRRSGGTLRCYKKNLRRHERTWKWNRLRFFHHFSTEEQDGMINQEDIFSSCGFVKGSTELCLGTQGGFLKGYQTSNMREIWKVESLGSSIESIISNPVNDKLFATVSDGRSAVLCYDNTGIPREKFQLDETETFQWSYCGKKAVCAYYDNAYIYDINTSKKILKIYHADSLNSFYTRSAPSFSPDDKMILFEGMLFDTRAGKIIHKFDKLSKNSYGVCNPNNVELILNSEIWDMRTFNLVKIIPELESCQFRFNSQGDAMYCLSSSCEIDDDNEEKKKTHAFKVYDAKYYDQLGSVDLSTYADDVAIDDRDLTAAFVVWSTDRENDLKEVKLADIGGVTVKEEEDEDKEEEGSDFGSDIDINDGSESDLPMTPDTDSEEFNWDEMGLEESNSNTEWETEDSDDNIRYELSDNSNLL